MAAVFQVLRDLCTQSAEPIAVGCAWPETVMWSAARDAETPGSCVVCSVGSGWWWVRAEHGDDGTARAFPPRFW